MHKQQEFAPISISVYTRIDHLRKCIESLKKNPFSKLSDLYIFSDAPKIGDEQNVKIVRSFCEKIDGFRNVHLYYQEKNDYIKNMYDARSIPLINHGKMIRLEDDNIVSPHFLDFMNQCLNLYKSEERIIGISGYSPPVNQSQYINCDVYLSKIFNSWTYATWSNKGFEEFTELSMPFQDLHRNNLKSTVASIHPALIKFLKKIDEGNHHAPDQVLTYNLIKHNFFQIKPVKSLIKNIGHDGSGINCGINEHFNQDLFSEKLNPMLDKLEYFKHLDKRQYKFFYPSLYTKIFRRAVKLKNYLSENKNFNFN